MVTVSSGLQWLSHVQKMVLYRPSNVSSVNSNLSPTMFPESWKVAINSLFKAEDSTVFWIQPLKQPQVLTFTAIYCKEKSLPLRLRIVVIYDYRCRYLAGRRMLCQFNCIGSEYPIRTYVFFSHRFWLGLKFPPCVHFLLWSDSQIQAPGYPHSMRATIIQVDTSFPEGCYWNSLRFSAG